MAYEDRETLTTAIQAGVEMADAATRMVDWVEESGGMKIPVAFLGTNMRAEVLTEVLREIEQRKPHPTRCKGIARFTELDSFIAHVNRFKSDESVVFAIAQEHNLQAVYDYHSADQPAWCQHRAEYTCPLSREWSRWCGFAGKDRSQDEFANFVDEHLNDLTSPHDDEGAATPIDVLEMARNLAIHTKGTFERKLDPTTGEHTMVCKQEHGENSTKIPKAFYLALPVYEGGAKYRVEARIRFRIHHGSPAFAIVLHRKQEILEDAFNEVREQVAKKTKLPLYAGTPEV